MGIEQGTQLISEILNRFELFGIPWMLPLVLVAITMLLITRDIQEWQVLALPVTVFWHIIGVTPHFLWYVVAIIMFVLYLLSLETIGSFLQISGNRIARKNKSLSNNQVASILTDATRESIKSLRGKKK